MRHTSYPHRGDEFTLARLIDVLSNPEQIDTTAELPAYIVEATRSAGQGFYRDGHRGNAVVVPLEAMFSRDLVMSSPTQGGALTGRPKILPADALSGFSVAVESGMNVIDWPQGGLPSVPAVSVGINNLGTDPGPPAVNLAGFVGEGSAVLLDDIDFSAANVSTKTVGCTVRMSRRLIKQGGTLAADIVRREMLRFLGERFDYAVLGGRGAYNEPTGICTLLPASYTDASLSWTEVQHLIAYLLANGVRQDRISWIGATGVRRVLASRARNLDMDVTPASVWPLGPAIWSGATIDDRPANVSRMCPQGELVGGDFSTAHLLVHGGITVIVDPRFDVTGKHQITMLADIDVIVPRPEAFIRAKGVI